MQYDMIIFGEDWGKHPSSTQHLAKHLSKNRKIIWFNSIGLRRPKINIKDLKRVIEKIKNIFLKYKKSSEQITIKQPENIYITNTLSIPVPMNTIEHSINSFHFDRIIQKKLKKYDIKKYILWTSLPTLNIENLKNKNNLSIYYCCDDFGGLAGVDHDLVLNAEKEISKTADIILTSSKELLKKFPTEKTHLIPHGVDYDLFSTRYKQPADMQKNGKIAGFYGSIHDWLDIDLIKETAKSLPDWSFIFIGNIHTDISTLSKLSNIRFLGPRPHHILPSYLQHWDMAMLPFRDNKQIQSCNPLKLREYMASGTPIISTSFPASQQYSDYIHIASDKYDFIQKMSIKDTIKKSKERQKLMIQESWKFRAKKIEEIIQKHL